MEVAVIAVVAWTRRVLDGTRRGLRAVGVRFGHRSAVEPELEPWARQFFSELKAARPFQPSRDLAEGVLQRLHRLEGHADDGGTKS